MGQGLSIRVQIFTVFVALTGLALLGFLTARDELCWGVLAGTVFFIPDRHYGQLPATGGSADHNRR